MLDRAELQNLSVVVEWCVYIQKTDWYPGYMCSQAPDMASGVTAVEVPPRCELSDEHELAITQR